ncbi:MAG: acetylxylan esterase [Coraliomargarita sp.]
MSSLVHDYGFDPSYGYSLDELLAVGVPDPPQDYDDFWQRRFAEAMQVDPGPVLTDSGKINNGWREFDLEYQSTNSARIKGWCLLPESGEVRRVFVVMHGYGGLDEPVYNLPFKDAALFFPCARGISRSKFPPVSDNPLWHVLHDIQDAGKYVHGACVEDVWLGISAALRLYPNCVGHVGLLGVSFGGGIGAMALAFDPRVQRAHFNVPSFGNHPLRFTLKTTGSGAAVQAAWKRKRALVESTLAYYDAAVAATRIQVPVHFACAVFDPMVAPPGQFAVYNAVQGEKELFVFRAGHFDYPELPKQEADLLEELEQFFQDL